MKQQSSTPRYIIVLGTTYSGSGAVFDYLRGRDDLYDPLAGEEYQLPQVPYGLMALEAAAGQAFHPAAADAALVQFRDVVHRLARQKTNWHYGKNYARHLPGFSSAVEQFIADITSACLPMHMDWRRLMESPSQRYINKVKARLRFIVPPCATRLLARQDDLISAACTMHDKLFLHGSREQSVLLNQAGSGWNPVESTKYFSNRKVVLVTRDPRDQFAEMKRYKCARDVEQFVKWYAQLQTRLETVANSHLMAMSFEEFVVKNCALTTKLCAHLSIDRNVRSSYQPRASKSNIGIYQETLSGKEVQHIEKNLGSSLFCMGRGHG